MEELQFFDRREPYAVAWKTLPHWAQAGTICFITWRTGDSLPAAAERRITREREEALRRLGLATTGNWREQLAKLPLADRRRAHWSLFRVLDRELDHHFGECVLARPELSQIVLDALLFFDDDRYVLTDAVVMPNHVHLLVAFGDEDRMMAQCESWKRYSARQIQQSLGRRGEFWQVEQFDHLVRGEQQFEYFRKYIAENPLRSGLEAGRYPVYSRRLG
jgi:REP element-mobilizing transposase RayT